jgi:D-amino-acid oxidase
MTESINTVVIGAGVIGLACARTLALHGREVIIVDPHGAIGQETSSRNSEVIHAGIYYPPGSLKARSCVAGKHALYAYCEQHGVAHRRTGKLIVAPDAGSHTRLQEIADRARQNGVADLQWLSGEEARELEPAIQASAALLSPSTGIIDSHAFMMSLHGDFESAGGFVALQSRLSSARNQSGGTQLTIQTNDESTQLVAQNVINCAGLHASQVARLLHGPGRTIPDTHYARGVYFDYAGQCPFGRLIYPLPEPGGLGIHATLDMSGALRFGPDVEWITELDYSVDPQRAEAFATAIWRWWPGLEAERLKPAYAGIRPKLGGPDSPPADFNISLSQNGTARIVDLLGMESPGLTSALVIAEHVRELLDGSQH